MPGPRKVAAAPANLVVETDITGSAVMEAQARGARAQKTSWKRQHSNQVFSDRYKVAHRVEQIR